MTNPMHPRALHNYCLDKNFVTYYFEYGHPFEESKI